MIFLIFQKTASFTGIMKDILEYWMFILSYMNIDYDLIWYIRMKQNNFL